MNAPESSPRVGPLIGTAATAIVGGGAVGGVTNAVNGAVSLDYFRNVMRWDDVTGLDLWRAAIAQGVFEGLLYGVAFACVFTLVAGVATGARCRFGEVWPTLRNVLLAVLGCWAVGGVLAIGLAALSPDFYQRAFYQVPEAFGPMLRYAWVGGSIWGQIAGGVLGAVIGSIAFATRWRAARRGADESAATRPAA